MEQLQEKYQAQIIWHSYELRPAAGPPIPPAYRAKIEAMRPRMRQMAKEQYGLAINEGPFGINSRPALIGAKYAEAKQVGPQYHDAVFRAYWQQAQNIADLEVLAAVAEAIGLDRLQFLEALQQPEFNAAVNADIEQAFQFGLSGVPAMIFGGKYLVVGAQPVEFLSEVAEKTLAEIA